MQFSTDAAPALHSSPECGADSLEITPTQQRRMCLQITPEMISDELLQAVFDDLPPVNNRVH